MSTNRYTADRVSGGPAKSWATILRAGAEHVKVSTWIALLLAVSPDVSPADEPGGLRRIGYLAVDPAATYKPFGGAFRDGLRDAGYVEGKNATILWRFAANDLEALAALASELVNAKVEVLVADSTPAALAAKQATGTIPIVAIAGDLVRAGLASSLARPGGNVTGFSLMSPELMGKRLAILKEMAPHISKVGVIVNPDNPSCTFQFNETQAAAPRLGLTVHRVPIRKPEEIQQSLRSVVGRIDALLLTDDPLFDDNRTAIGTFAIQNRLPSICNYPVPDDKTCLIWYGPDFLQVVRRAAGVAARILSGAKPADLPVEQPRDINLIINARTAQTLRLAIPQSLRMAATKVVH